MTIAKPGLLTARGLLHDHLGIPLVSLGVVGDPDHIGGYHCGLDRLYRESGVVKDYSVVESARDRAGLTAHPDWASALDIGSFDITVNGRRHTLRTFSVWLVAQCRAGAPDTADIREIIYSPDGVRVVRYDRQGIRTTGDDSHLYHTHISEYRDADGARMVALFRRYLTEIGLLEDDMPLSETEIKAIAAGVWSYPIASDSLGVAAKPAGDWAKDPLKALRAITALAARIPADLGSWRALIEQAVVEGANDPAIPDLTPEQIDGLAGSIAGVVADELAARLQT